MLKKLIIAVIVLLILAVAALAILPGLVPESAYKSRLESELSKSLARDVTLEDGIEIATFPVIRAKTNRVSIANTPGFTADEFIQIDALEARIRLLPLLSKRVEIASFTLTRPVINLERRADGTVNWTTEDMNEAPASGPFKRDGRFTNYDPALDRLTITDGAVIYADAQAGRTIRVEDLDTTVSLPGLDAPLRVDGSAMWDGMAMTAKGQITSPQAFLSGQETPFDIGLTLDGADMTAKGAFREGQDIALDAKIKANVADIAALAPRLPLPDDLVLPPLRSLDLVADLAYDAAVLRLRNLTTALAGDGLSGSFEGDATYTDALSAAGAFDLNIANAQVLAPYLKDQADKLALIETLNASGSVDVVGSNAAATDLSIKTTGPQLSGTFTGDASYKNEVVAASGPFTFKTKDVAKLVTAAGLEQPDAAALGAVDAKGRFGMQDGVLRITALDAKATDGALNGQFTGDVVLEETPRLTGQYSLDIPNLSALDQRIGAEIPYTDAVGRITGSGAVGFQTGLTTLTDTKIALRDGNMTGDFTGDVRLVENAPELDGALDLNITSLRTLAASAGTELPPSTDAGEIFSTASVSGAVTGRPDALKFSQAKLALDALSGTGDFMLTAGDTRPKLTGEMLLSGLDVRPYMAAYSAQRPQGEILPWSETPINTTAFKAVDADITVSTPNVVMNRIKLDQTQLQTRLQDGVLTAQLPTLTLYGGQGTGTVTYDTRQAVPSFALEADLSLLNGENFLSAVSGITRATGEAGTKLSLRGNGASQAALMQSLTGGGTFGLKDGSIQGLDASAFLTGLDQAFSTKSIPGGLGADKSTRVQDLLGRFSMTNGVAKIDTFTIKSGDVDLTGGGQIDIGGQSLDFSLRPRLPNGSGLASFGIPLRIQGPFGQAKAGLDTPFLGEILEAKARDKAGDLIRDKIGGSAGDILGGVLGGSTTPASGEPPATAPQTSPEDTAVDLLEGLIKPKPKTPVEAEPTPETEPEQKVEDALKDLFGRKKKKQE